MRVKAKVWPPSCYPEPHFVGLTWYLECAFNLPSNWNPELIHRPKWMSFKSSKVYRMYYLSEAFRQTERGDVLSWEPLLLARVDRPGRSAAGQGSPWHVQSQIAHEHQSKQLVIKKIFTPQFWHYSRATMPLVDKDPSRAETREGEHLICPRERERRTKREREREEGGLLCRQREDKWRPD